MHDATLLKIISALRFDIYIFIWIFIEDIAMCLNKSIFRLGFNLNKKNSCCSVSFRIYLYFISFMTSFLSLPFYFVVFYWRIRNRKFLFFIWKQKPSFSQSQSPTGFKIPPIPAQLFPKEPFSVEACTYSVWFFQLPKPNIL